MTDPAIQKLGILAGKGALPLQLAHYCEAHEIPLFLLAFEESLNPDLLEGREHAIISLGEIGKGIDLLAEHQVSDVVMAGHLKRPSLRSIKLDDRAKKLLKKLGMKLLGGDDALLKALISFIEEEGFNVIAPHRILGGMTLEKGCITSQIPSADQLAGIQKAMDILAHTSCFDIGQSLVIEDSLVLGMEAAEGTDELIKRCAAYAKTPDQAVLVKAKKQGQDIRADMPTIGLNTIELLAQHHYAGMAVEANNVLVIDRQEVINFANQHSLFLVAI